MTAGDQCRAQGNALSVGLSAGQPVVVRHNTVTGEGDCLLLSTGGNAASSLSVVNNAWLGGVDWTGAPGERSCGHYAQSQPAPTIYAGNLYWQVKNGFCPGGSVCGEDPVLADPDMATFDPMPLPASALLDREAHLPPAGRDFYLKPRPNGSAADIGAVERQGLTLVPLSLYFNSRGRAKVELALARGKKVHDKRDTVKERDWKREQARLLRSRG